ncbi:MAG: hypothetical protein KJZ80_16180 [Hyphomicrobiaceae bacterium]|nr:hypothetical protein [Hyphomicrobiaceae bacterium]
MNGSEAAAGRRHLGVWRPLSRAALAALAALAGLAVALGLLWPTQALLEAWLAAFLVLAGLASASLGLLMIGHLLGEAWLRPVRGPLEAAASTVPLLAVLVIPLAIGLEQIYPWAEGPVAGVPPDRQLYFSTPLVLARGGIILVVWIGIGFLISRRGEHAWASAIGLALLAPTAAVAALDWVSSREPAWWSSVFAFAYAVTQLAGGLALALLVAIAQPGHLDPRRFPSLQRAALTLALLTLWVWFAQFLIIWMANLPDEITWYLARADGWLWLEIGLALPVLLAAIGVLLPPLAGSGRLAVASALLLVQYLGHMLWLVRPASPSGAALTWADPPVWLGLGLLWGLWYAANLRPPAPPDARAG